MTKPDETGHVLSVAQLNAADCLVSGMTDQETAEAVGVTRQTVCGWRNHHPAFVAALNARRLEVWGASGDRLRALLPKVLKVLEGALAVNPDPRVALEIVKLAGLDRQGAGVPNLGPYSIGPADPEEVIEAEVRRRRRDPFADLDMFGGGRVTAAERRAVLQELRELAG